MLRWWDRIREQLMRVTLFLSMQVLSAGKLYKLPGLSDSCCTQNFDEKKTSVMLTVTDKEVWDARGARAKF